MSNLKDFYKHPADFMYIFASDSFIAKLGNKAAYVISAKKANQKKLLNTTAIDSGSNYNTAYNEIKQAFVSMYGMTPQKALETLAMGGEVAGKNWAAGVYGIGKAGQNQFGNTPGASMAITVDPKDGLMYDANGKPGESLGCVTVSVGKNGKPNCYKYTSKDGNTYTSVRNEITGRWRAGNYTNAKTGISYDPLGNEVTSADMSSVWESLALSFSNLIKWLFSLFNKENSTNQQAITAANTQPNQQDGWVSSAGVSPWILVVVAAGTLFASGGLGRFWGRAKKKK